MFTGLYPTEHGATGVDKAINETVPTVLDFATEQGIRTACFTSNPWITPEFGFNGWDKHRNYASRLYSVPAPTFSGDGVEKFRTLASELLRSDAPFKTGVNGLFRKSSLFRLCFDNGGKRITKDACEWIHDLGSDDGFVFLNFMETHDEHRWMTRTPLRNLLERSKQARYNERYGIDYYRTSTVEIEGTDYIRRLMLDELTYVDSQLQRLWRTLKRTGRADSSLFILCSDHGEGLGEQGYVYHVEALTEAIVRTPLLVHTPNAGSGDVDERMSLKSIHEMIRSYLGDNIAFDVADSETYPSLVGAENTGRLPTLLDGTDLDQERSISDRVAAYEAAAPERKYLRIDGECSVRDIERRGLEETDRGPGGDEYVEGFLDQLELAGGSSQSVSAETRETLRDLGYL